MKFDLSRNASVSLDAEDALATLRAEFSLPEGVIYLDGNSLGASPKAALARVQQVVAQEWAQDLIKSWNSAGWYDMPRQLGNRLATLIGAQQGEVVVTDSTSINLFKAIAAALNLQKDQPKRLKIISERSNFPTDLYMAEGITRWLERGYELVLIDAPDDLPAALDSDTALVMLTHVNYRTGYLHDMQTVTAQAHAKGALILWDLAHSAGAVPVDLHAAHADFAVGCTYKYLNGGPGSPAFIWVPQRHQACFEHPLTGWWSHAQPFAMSPAYAPVTDIRRALCGTQAILSLALVGCGLDVFAHTTMAVLRKKSLALTDLFITLVEQQCPGLQLVTPREHAQRGSQVSLKHPDAYAIIQALIERGVIGDYRDPGILRFGFTPLYTRYVDVWDAAAILADVVNNRHYDAHIERNAVT